MNLPCLQDRVVLIIGAGRAPGQSLALALAAEGALIAANDVSPVLLDGLVDTIHQHGGRARAFIADATRGMPLRAMLDEVLEDLGRIDILINNPRIRPEAGLLQMDEYDWQRAVDVNLNGPFLATQLVARTMQEQGQGAVLNIVDINPHPGSTVYAASQQGLLALSQGAARELIAYNIRVYTLCPDDTVFCTPCEKSSSSIQALSKLAVYLCSQQPQPIAEPYFRVDQANIVPPIE